MLLYCGGSSRLLSLSLFHQPSAIGHLPMLRAERDEFLVLNVWLEHAFLTKSGTFCPLLHLSCGFASQTLVLRSEKRASSARYFEMFFVHNISFRLKTYHAGTIVATRFDPLGNFGRREFVVRIGVQVRCAEVCWVFNRSCIWVGV